MNIFLHTIGCRTNQCETAILRNLFTNAGFIIVLDPREADIALINTCTVTEKSDLDTRKTINRLINKNPHVKIALTGCQAQLQPQILKKMPNVRWIIGNNEKFHLPQILLQDNTETLILTPDNDSTEPFITPGVGIDSEHTRANIKIQDGCDNFCTYCEVPYARGRARSRIFDDILKEAQILVNSGHRELVLTGINIGAYNFNNKNLIDLIKSLERITNLKRIRISSIEPTGILAPLIDYMKNSAIICIFRFSMDTTLFLKKWAGAIQ